MREQRQASAARAAEFRVEPQYYGGVRLYGDCRKVCHATPAQARTHMRHLAATDRGQGRCESMNVYFCDRCRAGQVGHTIWKGGRS